MESTQFSYVMRSKRFHCVKIWKRSNAAIFHLLNNLICGRPYPTYWGEWTGRRVNGSECIQQECPSLYSDAGNKSDPPDRPIPNCTVGCLEPSEAWYLNFNTIISRSVILPPPPLKKKGELALGLAPIWRCSIRLYVYPLLLRRNSS